MEQLNSLPPTKIIVIDGFSFKLDLDSSSFGAYTRQGLVENIKVPLKVSFHSLKQSLHNPVASSTSGMLETPDLRCWGRSDQLHVAFNAILDFQIANNRLPNNSEEDFQQCLAQAQKINTDNKVN